VSRGCLKQKAIEVTKWSSVESKSYYPTSVRNGWGSKSIERWTQHG
jgi:hypothetical protein